ncbi:hypothetical protein N7474_007001 [Penicillium riverlandense]|uniref:uncharacterized protein n=1 Tax=Penicillium riverlandense TaxID=1903569 RepID=UPI0025484B47|nr:uncharacterized protein N7474_007001 [Penicillium riverlandense]KAJ5815224.1 hypothetical protein N7474_007001 [Penicillium riverlandense]
MAAESERPPYLNGASGGNNDADSDPAHRSGADGDMEELLRPDAVKSQSQAMSQVPKLTPSLRTSSNPASASHSVVSSRENSPVRSRIAQSPTASRVPSQTRKGSPSQDRSSPARSSTSQTSGRTTPSPTSAQLGNTPVLSPSSTAEPQANVPEKANMPSWAGSRRPDQDPNLPNTSHKRSTVPPSEEHGSKMDRSTPRAVTRGVGGQGSSLETVQEMTSNPSTPSSDTPVKPVTPEESRLHKIDEDATPRASKQGTESGSDSGGNRSSGTKEEDPQSRPSGPAKTSGTIMPQRSFTSLSAGARGKPADGSVRNMIVETETVSSIPQVSLGVPSGERGNAGRSDQGTLRMKPSTETIRPRKDKKKNNRRQNNLTSGPLSSKADVFEAKVASAVDEADASDSDETFVYESNPPDPYPPRQNRYHSRTPSATSMASQVDQLAGRARGGMRDASHSVTGKRSMKFTNNTYNSSVDGEAAEVDGNRNPSRVDASGTLTPRHNIGRHNRNAVHPSLFDNDSPFPQPQSHVKSPRHFIGGGYRHARHSNNRASPNYKTINNSKKAGEIYGFDFDAEGADDERTPLVGTPRANRSRGRRPNSASLRQMEYMAQRQRGYLSRYSSCVIIILLMLIVAGGAASFIVAATRPLLDVDIIAVQNVLATEQEIMLDLNVQAINPNLFPVMIDDTDFNIFAKSRYVGTDKFWREHGSDGELDHFPRVEQSRRRWKLSQMVRCLGSMDCVKDAVSGASRKDGGVDRGTDPITDPSGDPQTMLLGRVFHFDSSLSFEASPWNHMASSSKGQIRLARPGNKTEEGGTERWERVLQHPFELIVRGVVKYQLPLSSRFHSASVSGSVKVDPDDEDHNIPDNSTARIFSPGSPRPMRLLDSDAGRSLPRKESGVSPRPFTA